MKIGKRFNQLSKKEYFHCIDNHQKYTDFNTLGLYRSLTENEKLALEDKIEILDYANRFFEKTFQFLQLKDPITYFELTTLGQELTKADERQIWENIHANQEKILKEKKIRHRNIGYYSKHNCGYETCPLNGLMIRQGSEIAEWHMRFEGDKNPHAVKAKAERYKKQRKQQRRIINEELDEMMD